MPGPPHGHWGRVIARPRPRGSLRSLEAAAAHVPSALLNAASAHAGLCPPSICACPEQGNTAGRGFHLSVPQPLWAGQRQALKRHKSLLRLRERLQRPRTSQAEPQRPGRVRSPARPPPSPTSLPLPGESGTTSPSLPQGRFRPLQPSSTGDHQHSPPSQATMQSPSSQEITPSQIRRRAPPWSKQEVLDLIAFWGDESVMAEIRFKKRNANTYAKVSRAMTERCYSRDTEQCCTKIKELRQAYQKAREANGCSGSQPHTFRFYRELHAIMGGDATTTPPLSVDTCKGGVAWSEEEETLEDEEEEEEEDSAQAASGESISPPSQELILMLDPIASPHSQGGLLVHDPGEGTSGE
nr:uncharacterized protein LOC112060942 isoform X1 [Chrysemys picta bellii]